MESVKQSREEHRMTRRSEKFGLYIWIAMALYGCAAFLTLPVYTGGAKGLYYTVPLLGTLMYFIYHFEKAMSMPADETLFTDGFISQIAWIIRIALGFAYISELGKFGKNPEDAVALLGMLLVMELAFKGLAKMRLAIYRKLGKRPA
jgi:hypothetical protein